MSGPGSLREGRSQPDPSFVSLRSPSVGSEGWRKGRQAEARLDRGRADAEGSPRKRQLPRAIHAGTKAAADPRAGRKSRSEVCNDHGGRRPSIPAGTGGIGTVRPWAPALGTPGRPRPPDLNRSPVPLRNSRWPSIPPGRVSVTGESDRRDHGRQPWALREGQG